MSSTDDLTARLTPLLDRMAAAKASHRPDWDKGGLGTTSCICGWAWSGKGRSPARSLSLHIGAAERRADKQYDAEAKAVLAEMSAERAAVQQAAWR